MIDINKIRHDFPILNTEVYGKPLVYFDNGATTQKPQVVIDTISDYYSKYNSNIHRGVHFLSEKCTADYEKARNTIAKFINASSEKEVIFTRGTTESINLIAQSFGKKFINSGDEIIITELEHHSNIVPWQMLCDEKQAKLRIIPINKAGELQIEKLDELISEKTKLISLNHVSNSLGTVNPVKEIITKAHQKGIKICIDGAQAIQHISVDVQDLDADFYVFSGHKIYGPTGIGVLYGKQSLLEEMPPYQGGGDMISKVTFEKTTYNELPFKFEAGTANYIDAIALSTAIEYVSEVGLQNIGESESQLLDYATKNLQEIEGLKIYGTAKNKASVISFLMEGIHYYDVGLMLDKMGIAVRTGSHCTQPLMDKLGIDGTVRASFAFYNTIEEIDKLVEGLKKIKVMFG